MKRLFQYLLAGIVIFATPLIANAQDRDMSTGSSEEGEIETDRDSFTPATATVGLGRSVLEASYSFIDNRRGPDAHSFPEAILRRGISDRWELRLGWNYEAGGPTGAVSGIDFGDEDFMVERSSEILYGVKYETSRQSGWLPESSVIVQGYTPTSGPSNVSRATACEVFGWTLPNGWQWNSALRFGTANDQGDNFNQWAPSTVLKIPLSERWNVHAEYFGIMSDGKTAAQSQHYASFGGHVLLSKDVELGLRIGFGLNDQTPNFFSNVGVGWRF